MAMAIRYRLEHTHMINGIHWKTNVGDEDRVENPVLIRRVGGQDGQFCLLG